MLEDFMGSINSWALTSFWGFESMSSNLTSSWKLSWSWKTAFGNALLVKIRNIIPKNIFVKANHTKFCFILPRNPFPSFISNMFLISRNYFWFFYTKLISCQKDERTKYSLEFRSKKVIIDTWSKDLHFVLCCAH